MSEVFRVALQRAIMSVMNESKVLDVSSVCVCVSE